MRRHYFLSDNLNDLEHVERELEDIGLARPQVHVLSEDDAGVESRHLNEVEDVLKKDVVHGTERGAVIGVIGAALVLLLCWLTGVTATYTWVPAVFLAVVVLGFCTWEGGLIGITKPNSDFARFRDDLRAGRHVLFVDVDREQQPLLRRVINRYPGLQPAGKGSAAPRWLITLRQKWAQFLRTAP
jgi:hypothetical protein